MFAATILILANYKMPVVRMAGFEENEKVMIYPSSKKPLKRFPLHHMPLAVTYFFVGKTPVVDPTVRET